MKCNTCQGTGNVDQRSKFGKKFRTPCRGCHGLGEIDKPRAASKLSKCREIIEVIVMDDDSEFSNQVSRVCADIDDLIKQLAVVQAT